MEAYLCGRGGGGECRGGGGAAACRCTPPGAAPCRRVLRGWPRHSLRRDNAGSHCASLFGYLPPVRDSIGPSSLWHISFSICNADGGTGLATPGGRGQQAPPPPRCLVGRQAGGARRATPPVPRLPGHNDLWTPAPVVHYLIILSIPRQHSLINFGIVGAERPLPDNKRP